MGGSDFKIFRFETVKINRNSMKKFLLCINRDNLKVPRQIFFVKLQAVRVRIFSIFAQVLGSRTETSATSVDKKAESWSSFSRYSLSSHKSVILFGWVYFTATSRALSIYDNVKSCKTALYGTDYLIRMFAIKVALYHFFSFH